MMRHTFQGCLFSKFFISTEKKNKELQWNRSLTCVYHSFIPLICAPTKVFYVNPNLFDILDLDLLLGQIVPWGFCCACSIIPFALVFLRWGYSHLGLLLLTMIRKVGVWSLPWRWHILFIPLTTGRGTGAETCGLDDVFPPDDLCSRPEALVFYNPSPPRMFLSLDLLSEYRI